MRRALASFLLAVFSFPLIAPALFVDAESQLPECCRRVGKHHCAMSTEQPASTTGASFGSNQARCPLYPGGLSAPASGYAAILKGFGAVFGALASHPSVHAQTEAGYRISFGRSAYKRGPPVVLS
jgi:hypothetical protein